MKSLTSAPVLFAPDASFGRGLPDPAAPPLDGSGEFVGALDLGTNNCRLLIASVEPGGFRVVDAFSRSVRLGEGLATSGLLGEAAMRRAIQALTVCASKLEQRRVSRGRYVATAACRQAGNCDDFLARVRNETGLSIEIISTEEEARLAVAGCTPLLDRSLPYGVVFDIGGGSTELAWIRLPGGEIPLESRGAGNRGARFRRAEVLGVVSLPVGVMNLAERYGSDRVPPAQYAAMVGETRKVLAEFAAFHGAAARIAADEVQMVGCSGTVTTLAGIDMGLIRYNREVVDGRMLSFEAIGSISARLSGMDWEERMRQPCIGRDRADLVVAGCAILEGICEVWPVGRLRVADRGIREGILFSLIGGSGAS